MLIIHALIESAKSIGSIPRNILMSYCAHNSYTIPLLTRHCEWSKEGGLTTERVTVTFACQIHRNRHRCSHCTRQFYKIILVTSEVTRVQGQHVGLNCSRGRLTFSNGPCPSSKSGLIPGGWLRFIKIIQQGLNAPFVRHVANNYYLAYTQDVL